MRITRRFGGKFPRRSALSVYSVIESKLAHRGLAPGGFHSFIISPQFRQLSVLQIFLVKELQPSFTHSRPPVVPPQHRDLLPKVRPGGSSCASCSILCRAACNALEAGSVT